jgi:hypothetical protein
MRGPRSAGIKRTGLHATQAKAVFLGTVVGQDYEVIQHGQGFSMTDALGCINRWVHTTKPLVHWAMVNRCGA